MTNRDVVWTRVTADTGGLRQNAVQAHRLDGRLTTSRTACCRSTR